MAELIRLYRTRFDAWDAPIFLAGESYGTTRAMMVAEALKRRRTRLTGVVLSQAAYPRCSEVPRSLNEALAISDVHGRRALSQAAVAGVAGDVARRRCVARRRVGSR